MVILLRSLLSYRPLKAFCLCPMCNGHFNAVLYYDLCCKINTKLLPSRSQVENNAKIALKPIGSNLILRLLIMLANTVETRNYDI